MYCYTGKSVSNDHLGSNTDSCYIQNSVIMTCVIKRLMKGQHKRVFF